MLVKIYLANVNIRNKEQLIKQLLHAVDAEKRQGPGHKRLDQGISLILQPTWYAEYATIANIYSIPGSDISDISVVETLPDTIAMQHYQVFMKGNGSFSMDKEWSEIMIDCPACEGTGGDEDDPCTVCQGTGKVREADYEEDPE